MTNIKTHFENKKHYLDFRAEWACAVNSPRAKSTLTPCDEWLSTEGEYGKHSVGTGRFRTSGWITSAHSLLFNILCEKPLNNGFTMRTTFHKLNPNEDIYVGLVNHGLYWAARNLNKIIEDAQKYVEDTENTIPKWLMNSLETFIEPFVDTVSYEMLAKLPLVKVEAITPSELKKRAA